jgi:CHAT domain-containing protein
VESFGVLAQKKGAEAVVATLWPVADGSTPLLMRVFYQVRQSQPGVAKAEALRQAQLALLRGGTTGTAPLPQSQPPSPPQSGEPAPVFTPDPQRPYAHPFFWAPFILIGNWK